MRDASPAMTPADEQFVRAQLRKKDLSPKHAFRLEQLGDAAFDFIVKEAWPGLRGVEQVWALRRLVLLSRHFCVSRKPELVELALSLASTDEIEVRSGAVAIAIGVLGLLEQLRNTDTAPLRARVRAVVTAALERGLDQDQGDYARRFLAE
jgi:hypothetical protein